MRLIPLIYIFIVIFSLTCFDRQCGHLQGDITQGDITQGDITQGDITQDDITQGDITQGDITLDGNKCILLVLDPYYSNLALLEAAYAFILSSQYSRNFLKNNRFTTTNHCCLPNLC